MDGQAEAWRDAAAFVDDKWSRALEKAERVRQGFAALLGAGDGEVALGQNTHELVTRFLSALPLASRPRLVTTDGEFHTIRRQLDRLAEERWVEVVKVAASPADAIAERLVAAIDDRTSAALVSSVLFENGHIVPGLGDVLRRCRAMGAELLVDAYHHLDAVPFDLGSDGLQDAFVVGGGYKYCQLGEGNCFLRVPPGRDELRPVLTGWFSEFDTLSRRATAQTTYGAGPARWAGSTYDPVSHYRAARVFEFFAARGLAPAFLREVGRHQVDLLAREFDALGVDPAVIDRDRTVPLERVGGFLALRAPLAVELSERLRVHGVWTDARGGWLRFGPAPYLCDEQLRASIGALGEVLRTK
jgi:kynureninase